MEYLCVLFQQKELTLNKPYKINPGKPKMIKQYGNKNPHCSLLRCSSEHAIYIHVYAGSCNICKS